MAESASHGEKTYNTLANACRSFLKHELPLAGVIRRDRRVRESIRNQAPLLTRPPTTAAASDVEAIPPALLTRQRARPCRRRHRPPRPDRRPPARPRRPRHIYVPRCSPPHTHPPPPPATISSQLRRKKGSPG